MAAWIAWSLWLVILVLSVASFDVSERLGLGGIDLLPGKPRGDRRCLYFSHLCTDDPVLRDRRSLGCVAPP